MHPATVGTQPSLTVAALSWLSAVASMQPDTS